MWKKAEAIASSVNVVICKPRTVQSSRYRSNAGWELPDGNSSINYNRRNIYFPFIDHCVAEFTQHFPADTSNSLLIGYKLLPKSISTCNIVL